MDLPGAVQKPGECPWAYGDMLTNDTIAVPAHAGLHANALTVLRRFDPQQLIGEHLCRTPADFTDARMGRGPARQSALINPPLDRNLGARFQLEIPLARFIAIVVLHGALDINRVRIMALDQARIITIDGVHQCPGLCNLHLVPMR